MYPGLSHDEIIEECLKELKHHSRLGRKLPLSVPKKVFSVCRLMNPFKRSFLTLRGLTKSLTFRIRIFRFATSQSRFSPQAEEKS